MWISSINALVRHDAPLLMDVAAATADQGTNALPKLEIASAARKIIGIEISKKKQRAFFRQKFQEFKAFSLCYS